MRLLIFLLAISIFSSCANHVNYKNKTVNAKKVAVEGYDIVAYHVDNKAIHGSSKLSVLLEDVHYYFSSEKNKKLFEKEPEKYLPKYGGFCAIGIALYDGKFDIDPDDFLIDNGELYLFCPGEIGNWKAEQESLKQKADLEWAKMESDLKEKENKVDNN